MAELRSEQQRIAERATMEMLSLYGAFRFTDVDATAPAFIEASVSVADRYHREASIVGGDTYLAMRRDAAIAQAGFSPARPVFDAERLRRDLIILGPVAAKKLMSQGVRIQQAAKSVFTLTSGRVSTAALGGVRDTISLSTRADSQAIAYARQVSAGACDFCVLLAGNLYKSAETAMFAGGGRRRSKIPQKAGATFHDHCRCALVTIFRGQLPEDARADRRAFSQAWYDATQQGMSHPDFLASIGADYEVS